MSLVYLCNRCGAIGKPTSGNDQRDPGPFLPAGWSSAGISKHLCKNCVSDLKEPEAFGRVPVQ